jgi:hypothetical protein
MDAADPIRLIAVDVVDRGGCSGGAARRPRFTPERSSESVSARSDIHAAAPSRSTIR